MFFRCIECRRTKGMLGRRIAVERPRNLTVISVSPIL